MYTTFPSLSTSLRSNDNRRPARSTIVLSLNLQPQGRTHIKPATTNHPARYISVRLGVIPLLNFDIW